MSRLLVLASLCLAVAVCSAATTNKKEGASCKTGTKNACGPSSPFSCCAAPGAAPGASGKCVKPRKNGNCPKLALPKKAGLGAQCHQGTYMPCGDSTTLMCCSDPYNKLLGAPGVCMEAVAGACPTATQVEAALKVGDDCKTGTLNPCKTEKLICCKDPSNTMLGSAGKCKVPTAAGDCPAVAGVEKKDFMQGDACTSGTLNACGDAKMLICCTSLMTMPGGKGMCTPPTPSGGCPAAPTSSPSSAPKTYQVGSSCTTGTLNPCGDPNTLLCCSSNSMSGMGGMAMTGASGTCQAPVAGQCPP